MRGVSLFIILVTLPALAALGHDIWLFYDNYGFGNIMGDLRTVREEKGLLSLFSAAGYLWTHYGPESYQWVAENSDPRTWAIINKILAQKAVFVGAVFAGFFYVLLAVLKLLNVWPFGGERRTAHYTGSNRTREILGGKSSTFKYKRK